MERKSVLKLGVAGIAGTALGAISLDGANVSVNIAEVGPVAALVLLLIALIAFMVYGLFKGWIVPKPYYDSAQTRAAAAEAANERLSERAAKLTDTNAVQARTIEKNSAAADTTIKVMEALQDARAQFAAGGTE